MDGPSQASIWAAPISHSGRYVKSGGHRKKRQGRAGLQPQENGAPEHSPAAQRRFLQTQSVHSWRTSAARRLAQLLATSRDLARCRNCLCLAAKQYPIDSYHISYSAALDHYHRAYTGAAAKILDIENLKLLGIADSELHNLLAQQTKSALSHSRDPFEETEIGIIVQNDEVIDVACCFDASEYPGKQLLLKMISYIDLIETRHLKPQIENQKIAVLHEAKTFGIQLLSQVPLVRASRTPGAVVLTRTNT